MTRGVDDPSTGSGTVGGSGGEGGVFPPTLREVMLRPRWIALLLLCLVVAGVFAWLGQWQLGRAIDVAPPPAGATEQVRPLEDVVAPGEYLPGPLVGQRVEVTGRWVAEDFLVVASRVNDGVEGFWVTGQLRLHDDRQTLIATPPVSLAVAIAWAPTRADAEAAASAMSTAPAEAFVLTGRLVSDEGPVPPPRGADAFEMTRMSPAALLSQWHDTDGLSVYRPYLVAEERAGFDGVDGIIAISAPPPEEGSGVNWLNIFYAAEWLVFAGFAFYLWYRLARDAWEREVEELEDQSSSGAEDVSEV